MRHGRRGRFRGGRLGWRGGWWHHGGWWHDGGRWHHGGWRLRSWRLLRRWLGRQRHGGDPAPRGRGRRRLRLLGPRRRALLAGGWPRRPRPPRARPAPPQGREVSEPSSQHPPQRRRMLGLSKRLLLAVAGGVFFRSLRSSGATPTPADRARAAVAPRRARRDRARRRAASRRGARLRYGRSSRARPLGRRR